MPLTSQLWSRITASDPGLLRLLLAARGTLSVLLTTLLCMLVAHLLAEPVIPFTAGLILSMLGPFFMREPSWQQRVITLLLLTVPAIVVAVATAASGRSSSCCSCSSATCCKAAVAALWASASQRWWPPMSDCICSCRRPACRCRCCRS
jgi:hypothetical protein